MHYNKINNKIIILKNNNNNPGSANLGGFQLVYWASIQWIELNNRVENFILVESNERTQMTHQSQQIVLFLHQLWLTSLLKNPSCPAHTTSNMCYQCFYNVFGKFFQKLKFIWNLNLGYKWKSSWTSSISFNLEALILIFYSQQNFDFLEFI